MRMCCVCYLCMTGLLWSRTAFTHVTAYIYYSIIIVSNWLCKYVSPKSSINHLVVCACVCVSVQRCAQSTASAIWENNTKIECSCRDEPNEVAIAMRERIAHICRAPWRPVANTHCICAVGGCYLSLSSKYINFRWQNVNETNHHRTVEIYQRILAKPFIESPSSPLDQ